MRKNLLTVAVSSAALLFATAVYADGSPLPEPEPPLPPEPVAEPEPAPVYEAPAEEAYDWYTTIFAGAAFGDSLNIDDVAPGGGVDFEVAMETGYLLGWTLGYDNVLDGDMIQFRPEMELSFRQQDVDIEGLIDALGGGGVPDLGDVAGSSDLLTVMANLWVDFDLGNGFVPYLGGGAGYGWSDAVIIEAGDFVWQFGGGVNFDISNRVFAGLGYRYLGGNFEADIDPTGAFIGPLTVEYSTRQHEVMANLGVRF